MRVRSYFLGMLTIAASDLPKILENSLHIRALLRSLVPARLGDRPHLLGDPWGLEATRPRWPFTTQDHDGDIMIRVAGEGRLSCGKLEAEPISLDESRSGDRHASVMIIDKE